MDEGGDAESDDDEGDEGDAATPARPLAPAAEGLPTGARPGMPAAVRAPGGAPITPAATGRGRTGPHVGGVQEIRTSTPGLRPIVLTWYAQVAQTPSMKL